MEHWENRFVEPTISRTNSNNDKAWIRDMSYLRASSPKQIRAPTVPENVAEHREPIYDIPSLSQSTSSLSLSVTEFDRERTTAPIEITDDHIMQGAAILKAQLLKQQEELIQQEARFMASPQSTPTRSREYNNSAYFSDTEDEDEQDNYNAWGIEKATPSHFSFVDVHNDEKWAEFSNQDNVFTKYSQGHFSSNESRASRLSSSPDHYIDRPPKRVIDLEEKKIPHASFDDFAPTEQLHKPASSPKKSGVSDAAYSMFMSGTSMSSYSPPNTSKSSPSRAKSSQPSKPQSPPKTYPLNRGPSAISTAESEALDILASQFSTEEVTPVAPIRKKTESPIKASPPPPPPPPALPQVEVKREPKKKAPKYPMVVKPIPMPGDLAKSVVSPFTNEYRMLLKDPAFLHAQGAGTLWQSLISQHVKFPSKWWNGSRSPPMGLGERRMWQYVGRHRIGGDKALNLIVNNRGAAGRILMHIIVKEETTLAPALDVAVGCFHPNARGVRTTTEFEPLLEDCRDIWLATRRRFPDDLDVENSLRYHAEKNATLGDSPLGPKHAVHNGNMRAIFGEKPPLHTMFLLESELKTVLTDQLGNQDMPPSLVLLQQYLKLL